MNDAVVDGAIDVSSHYVPHRTIVTSLTRTQIWSIGVVVVVVRSIDVVVCVSCILNIVVSVVDHGRHDLSRHILHAQHE